MQQLSLMDIIGHGLESYRRAVGARAFRSSSTERNKAEAPATSSATREAERPARRSVSTEALRRAAAAAVEKRIDFCRRPRSENTRKRRQEAAQFEREAVHLEQLRAKLLAVADGHDDGTLPAALGGVTTRLQIETLMRRDRMPAPDGPAADEYQALTRAGIGADDFAEAARAVAEIGEVVLTEAERRARRVKELERAASGASIPGFYATPAAVVARMIELAGVRAGQRVLEPSAGAGRIADSLAALGVSLDTIEINGALAEILTLKGYDVLRGDFLAERRGDRYDRVLMNPPFERGRDIEHVRHAFDCLRPGGRLVAVMSEGAFCRADRRGEEFRRWLSNLDHAGERLPAGTFYESGTGVASRLLTINKPADE